MEIFKGFSGKSKIKSAFYGLHPVCIFLYFVLLFTFVFLWNNPVFTLTTMIMILLLDFLYVEKHKIISSMKGGFFITLFIIIINPLTSHRGSHILFYLLDNPITLEAFLYGLFASIMIFSMFMAFLVFNALIESERFLFLVAKFFPKIGFITNMSLRFSGLFKKRAQNMMDVAKTRGIQMNKGKLLLRMKTAGTFLKALVSWCLEEGMMIAEVLKAKEYGKRKRSTYNRFKWIPFDIFILIIIIAGFLGSLALSHLGAGHYAMYPRLKSFTFSKYDVIAYIVTIIYILIPIWIEFIYTWQRSKNDSIY